MWPYSNPMMPPQSWQQPWTRQPYPTPYEAQPIQQLNAAFVCGIEGAKGFNVPRGEKAYLFDSESDHFYVKEVGADGVPLPIKRFKIIEEAATDGQRFVTHDELMQALAQIQMQQSCYGAPPAAQPMQQYQPAPAPQTEGGVSNAQ